MNVLYATPYVPSCIRTRPYNLIRTLVRLGHRVTLLTAAGSSPEEQDQADQLRGWGMQVEVFPVPVSRSLGNCLRALPTREPLQAVYAYHPAMERRLGDMLNAEEFDVVHIEHLRAARLVRAVTETPAVYDSVDSISLLFEQASKGGAQLRSRLMTAVDLARTRRYEAWLQTQFNQVVVTSQRDKDALEGLARQYLPSQAHPAPITVVTNGVDLEYFCPAESQQPTANRQPPTVVFTGKMSYHANIAAALYFARKVLPHIWKRNPSVRFQIVGKDPPEALQKLTTDGRIQVTGTVDDIRPYLAQATVAVCPVPYAVGVQSKVLEAMAMGTPVVCTPAAFDGLDAQEEEQVLVADGPDGFATKVLQVISSPAKARRLSAAGRQYVEVHHGWEAIVRRLVTVYEQAVA